MYVDCKPQLRLAKYTRDSNTSAPRILSGPQYLIAYHEDARDDVQISVTRDGRERFPSAEGRPNHI